MAQRVRDTAGAGKEEFDIELYNILCFICGAHVAVACSQSPEYVFVDNDTRTTNRWKAYRRAHGLMRVCVRWRTMESMRMAK